MDDTVNGWIVTRKIFMEKVEIKIEVTIFYAENAPKTISRLFNFQKWLEISPMPSRNSFEKRYLEKKL